MRTTLSIALAIFCGVLIGATIGGSIQTSWPYGQYLWGIGGLVGGLAVYCIVEFNHFRAGVNRALAEVSQWQLPTFPHWHVYWRFVFAEILLIAVVIGDVFLLLYVILFPALVVLTSAENTPFTAIVVLTLCGSLWAFGTFCGIGGAIDTAAQQWFRTKKGRMFAVSEAHYERWMSARAGRTIRLASSNLPHVLIARFIQWLRSGVLWQLAQASAQFVGYLIAYVHSEVRVICFVDTALFVVVAHFMGFTLRGNLLAAALGAGFGVLNYWVVGIRILGVAPARRTT